MKKIVSFFVVLLSLICVIGTNYEVDASMDSSDNGGIAPMQLIRYTVHFDLSGGYYIDSFGNQVTTIANETIEEGTLIDEPQNLQRLGYIFMYWETQDGIIWDFDQTAVVEDTYLKVIWKYHDNVKIIDPIDHLGKVYENSTNWTLISNLSKSTADTYGGNPVEAGSVNSGSSLMYDDELAMAINLSGVVSSYGGCGPIALIGVLDYLSREVGYRSILSDPNDFHERVRLANLVLQETITYEIGPIGDKSTFTYPGDYVDAFNTMVDNSHLGSQLTAHSHGPNKSLIKSTIDSGMPVTVWTLFGSTTSGTENYRNYISQHYINIYGYEEYHGIDSEGNGLTKTLYKFRMNWGHTDIEYLDEDILSGIWGVITYEEENHPLSITPEIYGFPCQYNHSIINQGVPTQGEFALITNRLRTGYVWSYDSSGNPDKEYLVLSAKREGEGIAFLQCYVPAMVEAINFDLSLWSGTEGLNFQTDSVRLEYYDSNGNWVLAREFLYNNYGELSTDRTIPKNYYVAFSQPTTSFRFIVECANPTGDRNKGRVVLGNMVILYQ